MRKYVCMLLALSVTVLSAFASEHSVSRLQWMSGCWAAEQREAGSEEHWMSPAGGSMLGMARTIDGSRTVAFEFMRIAEEDGGRLVFIASPSGQQTASFAMVSLTDDGVVFENPEHDFPQRVIYRRLAGNGLLGRIEGTVDGELRSVDFPMKKKACENQPGDRS